MIRFGRLSGKTLFCSFCGKSQHDVRKLVAGPRVFICDGCVQICVNTIRDSDDSQEGSQSAAPAPSRRIFDRVRRWLEVFAHRGGNAHLVGVLK